MACVIHRSVHSLHMPHAMQIERNCIHACAPRRKALGKIKRAHPPHRNFVKNCVLKLHGLHVRDGRQYMLLVSICLTTLFEAKHSLPVLFDE